MKKVESWTKGEKTSNPGAGEQPGGRSFGCKATCRKVVVQLSAHTSHCHSVPAGKMRKWIRKTVAFMTVLVSVLLLVKLAQVQSS